ncbi:hypothetical protein BS78_05G003600 [Paspalum vaginatum]|nr:hypothetical protein BS78_05G003600 [Paspalum vaginatum]
MAISCLPSHLHPLAPPPVPSTASSRLPSRTRRPRMVRVPPPSLRRRRSSSFPLPSLCQAGPSRKVDAGQSSSPLLRSALWWLLRSPTRRARGSRLTGVAVLAGDGCILQRDLIALFLSEDLRGKCFNCLLTARGPVHSRLGPWNLRRTRRSQVRLMEGRRPACPRQPMRTRCHCQRS